MKSEMKVLPVKKIAFDESIYPRSHVDWITKAKYYNALKSGAEFPSVVVGYWRGRYLLIDGAHRLEAHKDFKTKHLDVEVLKGLTKQEMFIEAVKRNAQHGRQFSAQEISKVVVTLTEWKVAKTEISKIVAIPADELKKFVADRLTRVSETGKDFILKKAFKHLSGNEVPSAWNVEEIQVGYEGSSQEKILDEAIKLFQSRLIDMKNKVVKRKVKSLAKAIKEYI